jgi:hypothetical protein
MRLLLVNPRFPESFWTFKWAIDEILPRTPETCGNAETCRYRLTRSLP